MMDVNVHLLQWSIHFLIKNASIKNENISNKELAEELNKPITTKLEKRKVHSPFIDNIWDDLVDKGVCFLLFVVDIFSKYAWVIP